MRGVHQRDAVVLDPVCAAMTARENRVLEIEARLAVIAALEALRSQPRKWGFV